MTATCRVFPLSSSLIARPASILAPMVSKNAGVMRVQSQMIVLRAGFRFALNPNAVAPLIACHRRIGCGADAAYPGNSADRY